MFKYVELHVISNPWALHTLLYIPCVFLMKKAPPPG